MLVKKLGMLLVLVMVLVTLAAPATRVGACSGDDCGCGLIFEECRLECNGNLSCISGCKQCMIACSKACCGW
jgi:hypothetical protein